MDLSNVDFKKKIIRVYSIFFLRLSAYFFACLLAYVFSPSPFIKNNNNNKK